ncbi:polysaccharide deacetylase family protein [Brevundimonas sp.]|uniref:polysaccharide deacetylase family protein n=1 Tax=Brevundimonas sp. TaxID=1871086 RepID=UPI002FDB646E
MRSLAVAVSAWLAAATAAFAQTPHRMVAVTFDDLPYQASAEALCDPETALRLTTDFLAMLRPLETHGTAFVNEGKGCDATRAALMPTILSAWLDAGLDLGNHTASHINIHRNTVETYLADVDAGATYTRAALEARGRRLHWFRHPYLWTGETSQKKAAIAEGLAARGYDVAPVTIDNNDWLFGGAYRRAEAVGDEDLKARIGEAYLAHMAAVLDHLEPYSAELTGGREPAQILLLHANSLNRDWYPRIHALYLARGYRFVTLEAALADPIYGHADAYVRANGVSWLHRWTQTDGRPIRWEPDPPQWITDLNDAR